MNMRRPFAHLALMTLLIPALGACGQSATTTTPASGANRTGAQASSVATSAAAPAATLSPTEQTPPTVVASSAPVPAAGSASDAINAAYRASVAAKSVRVDSTLTSDTNTIHSTFDVMLPDRLHRITDINGKTSEMIVIGATTYTRANGGAWSTSAGTADSDILKQIGSDQATIDELSKHITDAKALGSDSLDGKPMLVYQYHLSFKVNDAGATSASVTTLWVGADSLPYRLETDGTSDITGKTTTSHLVNLYSGYNTDLSIVAPVP